MLFGPWLDVNVAKETALLPTKLIYRFSVAFFALMRTSKIISSGKL
jgi:hypothetical protein